MFPVATFIALSLGAVGTAAADARLEAQRAAFREAWTQIELGSFDRADASRDLLESYVLWPDLRAAWLRTTLTRADHDEVEAFLDRFGVLKPARELRYRYALHLANEGRLAEFKAIYEQFYQGLEIPRLDCLALQAEIEAGRGGRIVNRGLDLWTIGKSQVDECDPVFDFLRRDGHIATQHYAARYALAVEARNFTLARWLSRSLSDDYTSAANAWLSAQKDPEAFLASAAQRADTDGHREQLVYAARLLALRNADAANRHWRGLVDGFNFDAATRDETARHIALWSARQHHPSAIDRLAALPPAARDTESARWLVRATLLPRQWPDARRAIEALPADEKPRPEWQYWLAVVEESLGNEAAADLLYQDVAKDRSYYGFLAADAVDEPYALQSTSLVPDAAAQATLATLPGLVRARELFHVGLEGRGRSEWDAAIALLSAEEREQVALLAHDWGWHSRAIATVAKAGAYDDLEVRYPLPWRGTFSRHADTAGVADSWAYGVARSESLFMRDIRSSAGAIGIMQLMPGTGRETAREISLPYSGVATLTDVTSNIQLGTAYLGKMYSRFGAHRVLATAAYNAGPHRVENWLPDTGTMDARIWIENIPFNETRGYVRRVLTDETIFHWRLTGQQRRLSSALAGIGPELPAGDAGSSP